MGVIFDNQHYGESASDFLHQQLAQTSYQVILTDDGDMNWIEHFTKEGTVQQRTYTSEPETTALTRFGLTLMSWLPVEWLL